MPVTERGKFYYYGRKSRPRMMDELNLRYDIDMDHTRLNLKQYWREQNERFTKRITRIKSKGC